VIVDTRPDAGDAIAAKLVAKAEPDSYRNAYALMFDGPGV